MLATRRVVKDLWATWMLSTGRHFNTRGNGCLPALAVPGAQFFGWLMGSRRPGCGSERRRTRPGESCGLRLVGFWLVRGSGGGETGHLLARVLGRGGLGGVGEDQR